jgi:hypothetical protein
MPPQPVVVLLLATGEKAVHIDKKYRWLNVGTQAVVIHEISAKTHRVCFPFDSNLS